METILDKLAWRMANWLCAPPAGMPLAEEAYAEWVKPGGSPVKHKRWKKPLFSRGAHGGPLGPPPKAIPEFYHRGAYERHEISTHAPKKAVLGFRGKGAKTERRRRKR